MSSTTETKNIMLDALNITKIRLHTGATTDGTQNTITKSTSGLAEIAVTYAVSANGERDLSAPVAIENLPVISNPEKVSHFSLWDGTAYRASAAFVTPESYENVDGVANVTSAKFTISDVA